MSGLAKLSETLSNADFKSIPIIDLTDARSADGEKRKVVAMNIREACLNAGFFYIKNHGVPEDIVNTTFSQSKMFFDAPEKIKKSVDITKSGNFRGYMGLLVSNNDPSVSTKGDMHEAFNLGLDPSLDPSFFDQTVKEGELKHSENLWPSTEVWDGAGEFKSASLAYYQAILQLGQSLFPLFAFALGLPEDFFTDKAGASIDREA
ncbi:hypothetical protein L198_02732 [Cryptococcus wingfieldii CBS 7118]|uniref:Non-haem dioxygenase N-terminal domain-containing protein n=1 Tax=Cryptococcus wingfieldii CBS 7118 TaxID=1295528 RepID=A0A1E3JMA0_9TREE|nr:hypothetical protein L198_02732 [Cryptococcus wingfieldii CBS 7118]ODO02001.1 hypothetical protein L198_02732 [Cryptococcus wingfieldii CBS 7118]